MIKGNSADCGATLHIAVYEATIQIITFAGSKIDIKKKPRDLSVIMDNNLSFSAHIKEICEKLLSRWDQ